MPSIFWKKCLPFTSLRLKDQHFWIVVNLIWWSHEFLFLCMFQYHARLITAKPVNWETPTNAWHATKVLSARGTARRVNVCSVHAMKYAHSFVVFSLVWSGNRFSVYSFDRFINVLHDCFTYIKTSPNAFEVILKGMWKSTCIKTQQRVTGGLFLWYTAWKNFMFNAATRYTDLYLKIGYVPSWNIS